MTWRIEGIISNGSAFENRKGLENLDIEKEIIISIDVAVIVEDVVIDASNDGYKKRLLTDCDIASYLYLSSSSFSEFIASASYDELS